MTKYFTILFILLINTSVAFAQGNNDSSLKAQFEDVVSSSNNYQEFKVVKKTKLAAFKQSMLDSIGEIKITINSLNTTIDKHETTITTLSNSLETTKTDLASSLEKEDGISLFGMLTKKATYNTILFSIIGILTIGLLYFIFRFNASNSVTKSTKLKLQEVEEEFETHRQKKLEEQQQLRRKLQDEINKNRKV